MPRLRAKKLLVALLAWISALIALVLLLPQLSLAKVADLTFTVLSDGERLGYHRVRLSQDGDRQVAEIEIELEYRLAFITLFRYRHSNREVWQDGRLVSLDSVTDDDGESYWVRARASDAGLLVESQDDRIIAPSDILPTSYWRPETIERGELLDTQRGRIVKVSVEDLGEDNLIQGSNRISAQRYAVRGDLNLDIWYSPQGRWSGLLFDARGNRIEYQPGLLDSERTP